MALASWITPKPVCFTCAYVTEHMLGSSLSVADTKRRTHYESNRGSRREIVDKRHLIRYRFQFALMYSALPNKTPMNLNPCPGVQGLAGLSAIARMVAQFQCISISLYSSPHYFNLFVPNLLCLHSSFLSPLLHSQYLSAHSSFSSSSAFPYLSFQYEIIFLPFLFYLDCKLA